MLLNLQSRLPLSKLESNYMHGILTYKLYMAQLVPFLSENKQSTIKNQAAYAPNPTELFDGTSRPGEALAIVHLLNAITTRQQNCLLDDQLQLAVML